MITIFDLPQPEEIFLSACARCATDLLFSSQQTAIQYLFGQKQFQVSVDFPAHLQAFVEALPPGHILTVDRLIDQHSALPFYAPFLPATRVAQVREGMTVGLGRGLQARMGVVASHIPLLTRLRYCPLCIADDRRMVGFGYWRRVHQLPGVHVCPDHAVWLNISSVRARTPTSSESFVAAEDVIQEGPVAPLDLTNFEHQVQLDIARGALFLLAQSIESQPDNILHRYRILLTQRGLATYRGTVKPQALSKAFRQQYPSELLSVWGLACGPANTEGWLRRLVQAPYYHQHPICHLLLMHFLGHTPASFFALAPEAKPFGNGPWPCLNPACRHYRQLHIQACQVVYSVDLNGRPKGVFTCPCGFVYSRMDPDTSEADRWRKTQIEAYGLVWEAALRAAWEDPDKSLNDIARELDVIPVTVKRHAVRLGLCFERIYRSITPPPGPPSTRPIGGRGRRPNLELLPQHKRDWLAAIAHTPDIGLKILAEMLPAAYRALSRHAPTWFQEHTPHKQPKRDRINTGKTLIDWEERDQRLSETVLQAAARLRRQPGRPVRITTLRIAKNIDKPGHLMKPLHRLPRTAAALASVVETLQAFTIRRMWYVAEQARDAGYTLTQSQLFQQANVRRCKDDSTIQQVCKTILEWMNSQPESLA